MGRFCIRTYHWRTEEHVGNTVVRPVLLWWAIDWTRTAMTSPIHTLNTTTRLLEYSLLHQHYCLFLCLSLTLSLFSLSSRLCVFHLSLPRHLLVVINCGNSDCPSGLLHNILCWGERELSVRVVITVYNVRRVCILSASVSLRLPFFPRTLWSLVHLPTCFLYYFRVMF